METFSSPERNGKQESFEVNDRVITTQWLTIKTFKGPDRIPFGTHGVIIKKGSIKDWIVEFDGIPDSLEVMSIEIERAPKWEEGSSSEKAAA